jgi:hypothetical protein
MGVRMSHPASGGEYDAAPEQVPHLIESGWEVEPGQSETGETWPAELQRFEGQEQVRMRHPDLVEEIVVARSTVPSHRSNNWYEVDTEQEGQGEAEAPDDLDSLTVPDLQELLRARDLPVSGKRDELISRLRSQEPEQAEAATQPQEPEQEQEA